MRLVHFSDTHLGFRQFSKINKFGINQREADVAASFDRVIAMTIALAPDLVVIGGDIFHHVRPTNTAIVHAQLAFARLRAGLPQTRVIMVAGNHDTPRTVGIGSILELYQSLGIFMVNREPQVYEFPKLDLEVLAVADNNHARPILKPSGRHKYNVLLLHGETGGITQHAGPQGDRRRSSQLSSNPGTFKTRDELTPEELHVAEWDYIALGHYHVYKEIAPNEFYSGAIDYTSSNIWGELKEQAELGIPGKGIVSRDLETGVQAFHPIAGLRSIVELPVLDAYGMTPADANEAIRDRVESIAYEGAVVRLVIERMDKDTKSSLDHKQLAKYRAKALNFDLVTRKYDPERVGTGITTFASRVKLDDFVEQSLRRRVLPGGIDVEELIAGARLYLAQAEEKIGGDFSKPDHLEHITAGAD